MSNFLEELICQTEFYMCVHVFNVRSHCAIERGKKRQVWGVRESSVVGSGIHRVEKCFGRSKKGKTVLACSKNH